jgi:hypothetical protein
MPAGFDTAFARVKELVANFKANVKFYVEAKKPHGDIATADNYFQTIRYGWSSSTAVAVLHDFEQFEIVDCRYRPHIETALAQNLRKYHFSQYEDPEKFAENRAHVRAEM